MCLENATHKWKLWEWKINECKLNQFNISWWMLIKRLLINFCQCVGPPSTASCWTDMNTLTGRIFKPSKRRFKINMWPKCCTNICARPSWAVHIYINAAYGLHIYLWSTFWLKILPEVCSWQSKNSLCHGCSDSRI